MDFFQAVPSPRRVFVHPARINIPTTRTAGGTCRYEVPNDIVDQKSLWKWLKKRCPDIFEVYRELTQDWSRVDVRDVSNLDLPSQFVLHFRREPKPTAPSSPLSSSLDHICADAKEKAAALKVAYGDGKLTVESLSNSTKWHDIMSLNDNASFPTIGRQCIRKVIDFIRGSPGKADYDHRFSLILGSAKSGKSYSVRAASLFLFLEFSSSEMGRLMYVNGKELSQMPAIALVRSLALACHDGSQDHRITSKLKDDKDAGAVIKIMEKMVRKDGRALYVVVDGGPELSTDTEALLWRIGKFGAVVLCGKWNQYDGRSHRMFINGGFNEEESRNYLAHVENVEETEIVREFDTESILWNTGWVPGLLAAYLKDKDAFDFVEQGALESYIGEQLSQNWPRVTSLLSGVDFQDNIWKEAATGLFYRDGDGRIRCLSDRLLSFAANRFTTMLILEDTKQQDQQIQHWLNAIESDDYVSRIGCNAEQACILVCRYKQPTFKYDRVGSVTIAPARVRRLPSAFKMEMTEHVSTPTLFVPANRSEKGLDCYYATDQEVVVIQFSTAQRAIEGHEHTRPQAKDLFKSDPKERIHILLWVVYCFGAWFEKRSDDGLEFYEAYCNFGSFHDLLSSIDRRLDKLRGGSYTGEANPRCRACSKQDCYEDMSYCISCESWYHENCEIFKKRCKACRAERHQANEQKLKTVATGVAAVQVEKAEAQKQLSHERGQRSKRREERREEEVGSSKKAKMTQKQRR